MDYSKELSNLLDLIIKSSLERSEKTDFLFATLSIEEKLKRQNNDARYMAQKVYELDQPHGNVIAERYLKKDR